MKHRISSEDSCVPVSSEDAAEPLDSASRDVITATAVAAADEPVAPWGKLLRLALLVGGLLAASELLGIRAHIAEDPRAAAEDLRLAIQAAGMWGSLLFLAVFCVGELLHVPGLILVLAAVLAYGRLEGGLLAYVAGVASFGFSFAIVRAVGGKALAEIESTWIKRVLARLDAHPIRTIALLRVVLIMSPPVNYALALSSVRFRDYLLGSAIGLIPPMLLATLAFDWVIKTFL